MAVLRVNKSKNFTIMSNQHLQNKNLSLKAKGLLSVMLALPNDWDYSIAGLVAISKENETAIKSTLNELKTEGYLFIRKVKPNEYNGGRFNYIYDIFETPQQAQEHENQILEGEIQEVDFLPLEKQPLEILLLENQGQLSTNKLSTNNKELNNKELNNITPYIPTGEDVEILDDKEVLFNEFWNLYPKKINKKGCLIKYKRIKNLKQEHKLIINAVLQAKNSKQWTKDNGQYIPHPLTFLNQERWKDVRETTLEDKITNIDMEGWL